MNDAEAEAEPAEPLSAVQRRTLLHDDLREEYYKLADIVNTFDQRLLTIKGWGVTFSLATTALAFQQNHYGLFLVAAASALAFWVVEASIKLQQMRYYPRMGDIEVATYDLFREEGPHGPVSAPLIDWSWYTSWPRLKGGQSKGDSRVPRRWKEINENPGKNPFLFAHVAFPHFIVFVLGALFYCFGLAGALGPM